MPRCQRSFRHDFAPSSMLIAVIFGGCRFRHAAIDAADSLQLCCHQRAARYA